MRDHLAKLNFIALVGALLLFLLPWTTVQCSDRDMARQSGLEAVFGGVSLTDDFKSMAEDSGGEVSSDPDEEVGMAWFVALSGLTIMGGAVVSGLVLFKGAIPPVDAGLLATLGLVLILVQSAVGFPIDRSIAQSNQESSEGDELGRAFAAAVEVNARRTNWFYLELVLLTVPAGFFVYGKLPDRSAGASRRAPGGTTATLSGRADESATPPDSASDERPPPA